MLEAASAVLAALASPFLDPGSRTWWVGLLAALGLCALLGPAGWARRLWADLRSRSSGLDVQLLLSQQLLDLLTGSSSVAGAWWLATRAVRWLDATVGAPPDTGLSAAAASALYTAALFVAWDASRWAVHWLLHRAPALWAFHQVHHSASALTPLTFHRVHPVEGLLYQLRGALVTGAVTAIFFWLFRGEAADATLLGVSAVGLTLNVATGNLRHSHLWLRFPAPLERWLISPAQHQLHHSADPAHFDRNYGTWLAVWDRLAGTLLIADSPPERYGVPMEARNHEDDLISAWVGPFRDLARRLRPPAALTAALALTALLPGEAAAQAPAEPPAEPSPEEADGPAGESLGGAIFVYGDEEIPRVAGSAHAIDEEELARFEYDDFERVVSRVPGVYTRGEDGYGLRPNIGIRGANSDRSAKVTLMEDGVLLAPAPYAAPAAYYFPMSTRLTGVEVFKGPASIRFGPNTVGGAINVLTRPAPTAGPAGAADVAAGLYGTYKAHAWAGTGGDRGGIVAEGVHLRSDGFKHIDGGGETGFNRSEFMLKGALTPGTHELGLKLGYANETSHETYMGLTLEDYQEDPYRRYAASALGLMHWDRTMAELSWLARPGRHLQVRTVAYHRWFSRAWTKFNSFAGGPDMHDLLQQDPGGQSAVYTAILRGEEDSTTEDQVLLIGTNDRRFQNVGLQSTARWSAYGDRASSTLEGGVRLHFDDVHRLHTEDPYDMLGGELVRRDEPTQTTTDSQAQALALAAHLHEDLNFGDWNVLPGVRMEVVRTSLVDAGEEADAPELRATPLPGLGLLYRAGSWVDLFAGAHRGFSPVAPGQPEEVLPELSWNYEAGGRFAQGERHVEVVGFFNDYQNISGQCTLSGGCDPDDVGTQYNGGAVWIYGAEAVAGDVFLLPGGLSLSLSATYAFTRSRFRTGFTSGFTQFGTVEIGDSLPYVPEHQGGAELAVLHPRVELGVGLSARSGMLDEAGTFPVSELDVPALALLDASLRVNLTDRVALYGTGTNLTGSTAITSWRPSGARPTAPLMAMGGVKVDGGR